MRRVGVLLAALTAIPSIRLVGPCERANSSAGSKVASAVHLRFNRPTSLHAWERPRAGQPRPDVIVVAGALKKGVAGADSEAPIASHRLLLPPSAYRETRGGRSHRSCDCSGSHTALRNPLACLWDGKEALIEMIAIVSRHNHS